MAPTAESGLVPVPESSSLEDHEMNVTCPNCATVYRVDPAKVPEAGVRARCAVCSAVFAVRRETEPPRPAAQEPPRPETRPAQVPRPAPPRVEPARVESPQALPSI